MPNSEQGWRERLTPEQYTVLREKGTEVPFSGALLKEEREGVYKCVACGNPLFPSHAKFDSGTGWPSFWAPVNPEHIQTEIDQSLSMERIEARCPRCGAHLGHVFDDGPVDVSLPVGRQGKRYCINSVCLEFEKK